MSSKNIEAFRKRAIRAGFQMKRIECRCAIGNSHYFHVAIFGHGIRKNITLDQAIQLVAEFKAEHDAR